MGSNSQKLAETTIVIALLGLIWGTPALSSAGSSRNSISTDEKVKTLIRAVGYSKSPNYLKNKEFAIAVVCDKNTDKIIIKEVLDAFEKHKGLTVSGKPLTFYIVSPNDKKQLKKQLIDGKANAVYIPRNCREFGRVVVAATRELKILSIAGQSDYVHWLGTSLGVEMRAGKPKLMINLSGCKLEGVEFDSRLLRLASVIF